MGVISGFGALGCPAKETLRGQLYRLERSRP